MNNFVNSIISESPGLCICGLSYLHSISEKKNAIQDVINFYAYKRTDDSSQQFKTGLQTLRVLDAIRKDPNFFYPIFCFLAEKCFIYSLREGIYDGELYKALQQENGFLSEKDNFTSPFNSPESSYDQCSHSLIDNCRQCLTEKQSEQPCTT